MRRNKTGSYTLSGIPTKEMTKLERSAILRSKPINFLFSPNLAIHEIELREKETDTTSGEPFSDRFEEYIRATGFYLTDVRSVFSSIGYIGPIRMKPERFYEISAEKPKNVGVRGQFAPSFIQNKYKGETKKEIDKWLKIFEIGDKLDIKKIADKLFSINFFKNDSKQSVNFADTGFGTSQVFPLLVQAAASPRNSLTIAEQPEIHLNPKLQCNLADLFVSMVNRDQRVIVETHSEHLLLRLRTLIAKNKIDEDDVAIYFVEKYNNRSTIKKITVGNNGNILLKDWPSGFFSESLKESFTLALAQQKNAT